eukprot:11217468-Lingulodinium_polyedra.AAC.1
MCSPSARSVVLIDDHGLAFTVYALSGEGDEAKFETANLPPFATRVTCDRYVETATRDLRAAATA